MKSLFVLCLMTIMLAGCSSGPTSTRTADCREVAENSGDTMAYGDCMRGTRVNQAGY